MEKNEFERVNESLYKETLDNGLEVYLYNTKNTKNFYITITVKYGSNVTKYKIGNKVFDIIPGSAHFLEHKVMALSENKEISARINELGSLANAWTNYYGTNYNIFGSVNILENLRLLLDIFYNTNINEKCVKEEKGIIGEEIDMYLDKIDFYLYLELFKNMFKNSYIKNSITGSRSDIEKIDAKSLNRIYNDFYVPNNTFICVCGNFNEEEVLNEIKNYIKKLKMKPKKLPIVLTEKEQDEVLASYEMVTKETEEIRVKYAIKTPVKPFNIRSETLLRYYLNIILSSNFSTSSKIYEKYKKEGFIFDMSYSSQIVDNYVVLTISAICKDANAFLDNISKDIKKMKINKKMFDIKKKLLLKSYITDFDNIEDVEYNLCMSLLIEGKIDYNEYSNISNMNYKKAEEILSKIDFKNISIIRTTN